MNIILGVSSIVYFNGSSDYVELKGYIYNYTGDTSNR